ncbi:MAG: hypothetical protein COB69_09120 [Phycisphaera sp.]|nr:MAG: hypothetical protein COB69_09120 [Phycisphaera sp.]
MQSPLDKRATLVRYEISPGLPAWKCPTSGGLWINGKEYWNWLRNQPNFPNVRQSIEGCDVQVEDTDRVLISPTSGRLMTKFRVGKGLGFRVDYDSATGGFWLDKDEYDALVERDLHDELHLICDGDYQKKLRAHDRAESRRERLAHALGNEGKGRVESLAAWVAEHPDTELIRAYFLELLDDT